MSHFICQRYLKHWKDGQQWKQSTRYKWPNLIIQNWIFFMRMFVLYVKHLNRRKKSLWDTLLIQLHSTFCLRILFSSSTKVLSEVACPMSLFLFSFCWNVSTRRFLADVLSLLASSSVQPEIATGECRENRKWLLNIQEQMRRPLLSTFNPAILWWWLKLFLNPFISHFDHVQV